MNKETLFSIGDVARLFHLSASSLRHYETMGLIVPEYIDPDTGYRYYSTRQFEPINTIRYLRALDMPLPEIAEFLRDRNVDSIAAKLRQQKAAVAAKRAELGRIERRLENRLRQLEDAETAELGVLRIQQTPPCRLFWLQEPFTVRGPRDMELAVARLIEAQGEAMVFLGKVGVGITAEHLTAGEFGRYDGAFLVLDEEDRFEGESLQLPEETCAMVRFRGSHPEAPEQYRRLMAFLKEHGLAPAGFSREITLIDAGLTPDPAQFVTEIRIPVIPKQKNDND